MKRIRERRYLWIQDKKELHKWEYPNLVIFYEKELGKMGKHSFAFFFLLSSIISKYFTVGDITSLTKYSHPACFSFNERDFVRAFPNHV